MTILNEWLVRLVADPRLTEFGIEYDAETKLWTAWGNRGEVHLKDQIGRRPEEAAERLWKIASRH